MLWGQAPFHNYILSLHSLISKYRIRALGDPDTFVPRDQAQQQLLEAPDSVWREQHLVQSREDWLLRQLVIGSDFQGPSLCHGTTVTPQQRAGVLPSPAAFACGIVTCLGHCSITGCDGSRAHMSQMLMHPVSHLATAAMAKRGAWMSCRANELPIKPVFTGLRLGRPTPLECHSRVCVARSLRCLSALCLRNNMFYRGPPFESTA